MPLDLAELAGLSDEELAERAVSNPAWLEEVLQQLHTFVVDDRQQTQLAYYTLANPMALRVHTSRAREIAVVGGNRSSKTDSILAELAIQMTGHIPKSLWDVYPREKIRAPIRARIVCNSLTVTLEPIIKPKLRWDQWNGVGEPKDGRGHWGWIPRHCLAGGTWEKAYSEKNHTLTVSVDSAWVGPGGAVNSMTGYSTCQFMSYDQDLTAFSGSSLHWVGHDELPPSDIYRESRMRTLDVRGQIYTAFTPPDEAGISRGDVAWFFDEVYERGLAGPQHHPDIESIILYTERNRILSAEDVAALSSKMTAEQREVRLLGKFIHLSGVIFSLFTRHESWWCYRCSRKILPARNTCPHCTSDDIGTFSHVVDPFPVPATWPVVFVIDPHPRKADAIGWFAVSPSDDVYMVNYMAVDGTAEDIAREVLTWEERNRVHPVKRLMDPNIATETNDKLQRGWTMQQEYAKAGLRCDLANDEMNVGINEVNELLKPDPHTRQPRFQAFSGPCDEFIHAMTRWSWDDFAHRPAEKEPKERPRDKYKDPCDLLRYLALDRPTFGGYKMSGQVIRLRR